MRWLALVPGILLVLSSGASVLSSLVVPRANQSRALKIVGGYVVAPTMRFVSRRRPTWEQRDRTLAFAGPLALLGLFGTWLIGFLSGYTLILWPVDHQSFLGALREAGSSVFTLGTAVSHRPLATAIDYAAAGTGLLVVALEIAYVPTLYGAFNRREVLVTVLQGRAGLPAWGPEILARHRDADMLESLPRLYREWETWAADVAESHTNYQVLVFFRSPHPFRSWIVALLAVLDSAALYQALAPSTAPVEGRLCLRMGFEALREIATVLSVPFDPDPLPNRELLLTREEFDVGLERLRAVGFPIERKPDEAWEHFRGWRVNYEDIAIELARRFGAAPAPWSGTREGRHEVNVPPVLNRTPDAPDGIAPVRYRGRS